MTRSAVTGIGATRTNSERLVKPLQQVLEHAVAILFPKRASSKGAAKRRGNSSLVGQAFDMDDTPFHAMLGRCLLRFSFGGHYG